VKAGSGVTVEDGPGAVVMSVEIHHISYRREHPL